MSGQATFDVSIAMINKVS